MDFLMVPPLWCFRNPQRGNNRKTSASSSALRRRSWRFQSSFSKDSTEPMAKTIQNVYWHVLTCIDYENHDIYHEKSRVFTRFFNHYQLMNLSVVDKWKCSMFTDNGGTPKSSMFMAFSIQNHPAIGSKKNPWKPRNMGFWQNEEKMRTSCSSRSFSSRADLSRFPWKNGSPIHR